MKAYFFKKQLIASLIITVISMLLVVLFFSRNVNLKKTNKEEIVGVWLVDAVGAPFQPHLATFHSDHTMAIHNPEAGDPHTSDSMGMGPWKIIQNGDHPVIMGMFIELNADRTTNKYVNKLVVTYQITINGDTFKGPARAMYYNSDETVHSGPFEVTLKGRKIFLSSSSQFKSINENMP